MNMQTLLSFGSGTFLVWAGSGDQSQVVFGSLKEYSSRGEEERDWNDEIFIYKKWLSYSLTADREHPAIRCINYNPRRNSQKLAFSPGGQVSRLTDVSSSVTDYNVILHIWVNTYTEAD